MKIKANCSHPLRNVAGRLTPVTRWGIHDNGVLCWLQTTFSDYKIKRISINCLAVQSH